MHQTPRARLIAYGVAVVVTAISLVIRWFSLPVFGSVQHLTFFPGIMVAAYIGGFWSGLLATILSTLAADYFLAGHFSTFHVASVKDAGAIIVFVLIGAVISGLSELRMRAGAAVQEQANLLDLTHDSILYGI